ncbi:MAG: hypothetical protein ACFFB0_15410 [Promethearchaeota archaeon]
MKNINTKSLMVCTILFVSIFTMPMLVVGQENDNAIDLDQFGGGDIGIFEGFQGGIGGLFSGLGYGGNMLGYLFQMLFLQGLNLSQHEMLDNVFVLSANTSHKIRQADYNFHNEGDDTEIVLAPPQYNKYIEFISNYTGTEYGLAYCEIHKNGTVSYEIEVGAAITLVIWDNDKSFITAVNKLVDFFKTIMEMQEKGEVIPNTLVKEGISLLTWFLIHINDIFTGDELFVLNPITWQKLSITPHDDFSITKTWKVTGNDTTYDPDTGIISGLDPAVDEKLEDIPYGNETLEAWNTTAITYKDSRMQWLLRPTELNVIETVWTQFSFDLIQLWIKNFEIHIDVEEILNAMQQGSEGDNPDASIANAFHGCNIEFFLFTHHLAGAFLYNDTDNDGNLSYDYVPIEINGTMYERARSTEISHRLILGTVSQFDFKQPTINKGNKSISWGLNIRDVNISAVPVGVDLNSYLGAPQERLDYIYFGFTFEPRKDKEVKALHAMVKLDQFFAPWNDDDGAYSSNSDIEGLDLTIIYVSTVLHFVLDIKTEGEVPEDPQALLEEEHYNKSSNELKIGNYLRPGAEDDLEFVDIAGPDYEYGGESESSRSSAPAITSTIPVALWTGEMEQHDEYKIQGGQTVGTYSSDIMVQAEFNVLVWAVCYPQFEDGSGIWHDPSFSVFMISGSEGFWALIVLIAGIGLVGVATILIKRKKDGRLF